MEQQTSVFFDRSLDKGRLKDLLRWTFENHGAPAAVELAERLKNLGFRSAAQAGISLGVEDLLIPKEKRRATRTRQQRVRWAEWMASRGAYTPSERRQARIDVWSRARETMKQAILDTFRGEDPLSPLYLMAFSGARGNMTQVRQLIGMRGLMVDPLGRLVEFPIRSNFKEGMTLTEFIISCYGARKGIVDTALRTATAGYLTRRLVDVAHYQVVGMLDCGTRRALRITPLYGDDGRVLATQAERLVGRALARPVPGVGGRNTFLTQELAQRAQESNATVWVRSPLVCRASSLGPMPERFLRQRYLSSERRVPSPRLRGFSLCQRCYGWSLADAGLVHLGEAVGILAAQSIGEPGTQLTMRTFHTGGVFSGEGGSVLRAPITGWIHYPNSIRGRLARLATGRVGFLTREPGTLQLRKPSGEVVNTLSFPAQVLLLVREGQRVAEGTVLGEFPPMVPWREGELVLRLLRAPHGAQVLYHRVERKEPTKEPTRLLAWQSSKFPGWRAAKRREGLTRLRLASGEVLGVETNPNQFRKGDLVSPRRTCGQIQSLRPQPSTPSFISWGDRQAYLVDIVRGGFKRTQYQQSLYRFERTVDPYSRYIFRTARRFQPNEQGENAVCSPLVLGAKEMKVQNRYLSSQKPTSIQKRQTLVRRDVFSPFALGLAESNQRQAAGSRQKARIQTIWSGWKASFAAKKGVPVSNFQNVLNCEFGPQMVNPQISSVRHRFVCRNKQRMNWGKTHWRSEGVGEEGLLYQFPAQFSDAGFVPTHSNPLLSISLQLQTKRKLPQLQKLSEKGGESQGLSLRANWVPLRSESRATKQGCLTVSDWSEPLQSDFNQQKTLFLGPTNLGVVSFPAGKKGLRLGTLLGPPIHVTGTVGPNWTGQLLSLHRNTRLFRRVTEVLLPAESVLRYEHGALVRRHEAISALRGRAVETGDITSGIPRIEALLEARERTGVSSFVTGLQNHFRREYGVGQSLAVRKRLHAGQRAVLENVQRLYRSNGVVLDDKHVELIVRPMAFGEVQRDPAWHEPLARGELHPIDVLERVNQLRALYNLSHKANIREQFPRIEYQAVLLGLTKASLLTTSESFLSAASFQETSRVLARAGIRGRTDYLVGLKENLILGTRLPIGTAARHLLLVPETTLPGERAPVLDVPTVRETATSKQAKGLPIQLHWSDALVYLGRRMEEEDPKADKV